LSTGRLGASFFNGGPGVAVQVSFVLVCGGRKKQGLVNEGHLGVGERSKLDFDIYAKGHERSPLMWSCTDVDWNVYIWSTDWKARRFSRRRWLRRKDHSLTSQFALMYPDVPIPK